MATATASKYLLLGYQPENYQTAARKTKFVTPGEIPGQLKPLATGDAAAVIKAACKAPCGVLLFQVTGNP